MSIDSHRTSYDEGHALFRRVIRRFLNEHLVPNIERWEELGVPDRSFWRQAGAAGILGVFVPEEYGGPGGDFLYRVLLAEELGYCPAGSSVGGSLEIDQMAAYILAVGTEEQKRKWLPAIVSGEVILAIAMTEPNAGSDLQAIRTKAVHDGEDYIINGTKTYITSGAIADLILVACKTDPTKGAAGISMIMVEADTVGFSRGKPLKKMGMKASDTTELFFVDVRVPRTNILGEEGAGFKLMMSELPKERYNIAARALGTAYAAYEITLGFVKDRTAFGKKIFDFQNTQFVLADIKTDLAVGTAFFDSCLSEMAAGIFDNERSAMAKLWLTEMEARVVDQCVQLHGGAGYMDEYPISKLYTAARIHRIYGGTSEIMRMAIGRTL
ncbi:acyl-CoA dehydrogenase (plasmid) [Sphingomonas paeninsulae]|uniref:Cyclohexane-1-carbonyl-CoA dehydrogenase n=1 Tax=Sphingomonas paeninsulae TaxID=2319844 RepID=A0A494TG74_SPHPE|nr:acyl-CoA dehydrogenase family protein [Sphingomonas paeninsulae]AYJ84856.1 acyl-CoA dehydrogenase [Sphingomonas paeninsulae]